MEDTVYMDKRVLLTGPDGLFRRRMASALLESGFDVLVAERWAEIRRDMFESRPDVVLLDTELPGADGMEVCRAIRGEAALKDTPVIMVSERKDLRDRLAGFISGADRYLVKPVDVSEIIKAVFSFCEREPFPAKAAG